MFLDQQPDVQLSVMVPFDAFRVRSDGWWRPMPRGFVKAWSCSETLHYLHCIFSFNGVRSCSLAAGHLRYYLCSTLPLIPQIWVTTPWGVPSSSLAALIRLVALWVLARQAWQRRRQPWQRMTSCCLTGIELNAAPKWSNMAGTKDQGDSRGCLESRPPDFGPMHTKTVACCARDMTLLKRDDEEAKLFLISTVQFVATLSTNCSGVGDLSQCAWITAREELKCAQPSSGSQFFIAEQAIRLCTNMYTNDYKCVWPISQIDVVQARTLRSTGTYWSW